MRLGRGRLVTFLAGTATSPFRVSIASRAFTVASHAAASHAAASHASTSHTAASHAVTSHAATSHAAASRIAAADRLRSHAREQRPVPV